MTAPSKILGNKTNASSAPAYSTAAGPRVFAEEWNELYQMLVSAALEINTQLVKVGGVSTITADRDFYGRQLAMNGTAGAAPWADADSISGLYWYGGKQALRGGAVTGGQWNDAIVGTYSLAFGLNANAAGNSSVAIGNAARSGGESSVALGGGSTNSAYGVAVGRGASADANDAVAIGYSAISQGVTSIALGRSHSLSSDNSAALGSYCRSNESAVGTVLVGSYLASLNDAIGSVVIGAGASEAKRLNCAGTHNVIIGAGSTVATLRVAPPVPASDIDPGLVGIALGDTVPSLARLEILASTTAYPPLNVGEGTAPTSPNNGDIWGTSAGLFVHTGGVTKGPFGNAADATPSFTAITSGANVSAAMTVGNGATMNATGNGSINATLLNGTNFAAPGAIGGTTPDEVNTDDLIVKGTAGVKVEIRTVEELITLSTSGTTTDSSADLLPANSKILDVSTRCTQSVTGDTLQVDVGDASTAARFGSADLTAGNTSHGAINCFASSGGYQTAAAKLRLTCDATPTGGQFRVSVTYMQFTAPTS